MLMPELSVVENYFFFDSEREREREREHSVVQNVPLATEPGNSLFIHLLKKCRVR